ncbi:hypothetical protein [Companilactobacillus sp. FL22-1]|uniref:hypothetical protein n=1 Tax=Companilactobacillus sp. FL22-1 TaxID=3373892 RepID=UPI003753F98B
MKKVCFISSSGGHLQELMKMKEISEEYSSFLVTEKSDFAIEKLGERTYFVPQINRYERLFLFNFEVQHKS